MSGGDHDGARFVGHRRGSAGYRSLTLALFAAGMTTFVSMYAPQAALPELTTAFGVNTTAATLAISATTGLVAVAIIPASVLSERFGRTPVMTISAVISAALGVLIPLSPNFELLVIGRALQGIALAGVPAVAMAYLAEEVEHRSIGAAMGRYIAGTTLGGLSGRLVTGLAIDVLPWRWALEVAAVLALACTVIFIRTAPASQRFTATSIAPRTVSRNVLGHLRNPALACLFALAFLLMGGFVSVYNLVGFRLLAAPFDLPQALVSLVFCFYLAGTVTAATAGRLADRFGRWQTLLASVLVTGTGLVALLSGSLAVLLIGMLLFTGGFFAAHAVASGAVGRTATEHRAEASSLYLFSYYLGSAVVGTADGAVFTAGGWSGAVGFVGVLIGAAVLVAAGLGVLVTRSARRAAPS